MNIFTDTAGQFFVSRTRWILFGTGLFLFAWWVLSIMFHEIIIASPLSAFISLGQMTMTVDFWMNVGVTMKRFGLGLFFGSLAGFLLGLAAGLKTSVKWLLEPFRWSLMTMPPVVLVVVSMIWFGMGSVQTIFVTALLILPIIYVNTIAGIEAVDLKILEMGQVYGADTRLLLKEIYLPGIGGPVLAGLTLSAGLGIRIVVLAELLGAYSGIGYAFSLARTNLDTPALFAWIVVCLFLGGSLDLFVLNPVKKHIMKWKQTDDSAG
ncbi:MAG TPA: ABC transporter permease subunit [Desulfocapsa sulfexigens]|nr:ABC transporter permease subunit [Desulfocapsa sulfexigens]